jgi:hypothetical protein
MINSNDLRVGNWVLYDGKPTKVHEPFIGAFKHLKADPIELTAEVLEKAGFEYSDNGDDFDTWKNKIEIWEHDEGFCHSYEYGGDVNYLHQLQNLYYCLTQTELQIKF